MNGTEQVDAYMAALDHPFKAELVAIRAIIKGANGSITERIKWNAPSFYRRADMAVFHPRATDCALVVFVFPYGLVAAPAGLLEGEWQDRRTARFAELADVRAKEAALVDLVNAWVKLEEDAR